MCGITGFITRDKKTGMDVLVDMTETLHHRGPNDSGCELLPCSDYLIGLGHRRLSIIDLSSNGHQPMKSNDGRLTITYNGEIYNHMEIKLNLQNKGYKFISKTDTEVVIAAVHHWGLEKAVSKFNGMFAFALWDNERKRLSLCRDRIGIKPLYYGWAEKSFVFSSELKAFRKHPHFNNNINRDSLALFFRHNYIPAPHSIYNDIYKLEPGCIMELDIADGLKHNSLNKIQYWDLNTIWTQDGKVPCDQREIETELEYLLKDSVKQRMIADVPIGAFLSGGIDSSLIAAMMQEHSSQPITTFTIGFDHKKYDESGYAQEISSRLGTNHVNLHLKPEHLLDVVPKIPEHWDEPFADHSQIPTFLVSELARKHVTVALSGDGGDELFAGYDKYFQCLKWRQMGGLPKRTGTLLAQTSGMLCGLMYDYLHVDIAKKLQWRLDISASDNLYKGFVNITSHQRNPCELVKNSEEPETHRITNENQYTSPDQLKQMQLWDLLDYLPEDILAKVDRASMAHGLEVRVPLLDHRIIEFAAKIPSAMNIQEGKGKALLRNILAKRVPIPLFDRPKIGFGIPLRSWLRGELREWGESLLDAGRLEQDNFVDVKYVRRMWNSHQAGTADWSYCLWDILMFQAWLDHNHY